MPRQNIELPRLRAASWQTKLQAELGCSIRLDADEDVATADELLRLEREQQFWLTRAGGCRMNVSLCIHEQIVYGREAVARLALWIEELEIWSRLGLKIDYCQDEDFAATTDALSFAIQHPDLSSSLIAPDGAMTAQIVSISCRIHVSAKKIRPRKKPKREGGSLRLLSAEDRSAVERFVSGLAVDEADEMPCLWTTRQDELLRAKDIVQGLVTILFTGSTRNGPAVKVLENNPDYSLARLAPSVFHVPYIKAISDRARYLNVVSSCLETMQGAESPCLRRKVASLAANAQSTSNTAGSVFKTMELLTWKTLLANVKVPALIPKQTARENAATSADDNTIEVVQLPVVTEFYDEKVDDAYEEDSPTICFGEDVFQSEMTFASDNLQATSQIRLVGGSSISFSDELDDFFRNESAALESSERLRPATPIATTSLNADVWRGNGIISFGEEVQAL